MTITEYFGSLQRQFVLALTGFIFCTGATLIALESLIPPVNKITIYYTVQPLKTNNAAPLMDPQESSMKFAEAMSGWAKNPGFRQEVLDLAQVQIGNFKRKITATKQNRFNVFWTLKLAESEADMAEALKQALIQRLNQKVTEYNTNNPSPFALSEPSVAGEIRVIPMLWKILASMVVGLGVLLILPLWREAWLGRLWSQSQLGTISPERIMKTDYWQRFHQQKSGKKVLFLSPKKAKALDLTSDDKRSEKDQSVYIFAEFGLADAQSVVNAYAENNCRGDTYVVIV